MAFPMDVAPGFWSAIESAAEEEEAFTIEHIYEELKAGSPTSDAPPEVVFEWVRDRRESLVRSNDDEQTQAAVAEVLELVHGGLFRHYTDEAKIEFASVADLWVIAYAKAHSHSIVTLEIATAANALRKVKIPDIAAAFDIPCVTTIEMLRALNIQLN